MYNNPDPYDTGTQKYLTAVAIYDALRELVQTEEMSILSEIFADVSYDNQDYVYTEKGYVLQTKFDELSDYGNKMWLMDLAIMQIDKGEVHDTVFEALNNPDLAKRLGFKKLFIDHALKNNYEGRYSKIVEDFEYELRELNAFRYYETAKAFGKAMLNNGAPDGYNPYPDYQSFCYHLNEKIKGLKLTEEVKLIAECRALLTSYTKGGANYFSGRSTQRGYYISAKPVKRDGFMTSTELYSGIKKQLMSANRFSAKQFEKAVLMGKEEAQGLVDMVKKQASVA